MLATIREFVNQTGKLGLGIKGAKKERRLCAVSSKREDRQENAQKPTEAVPSPGMSKVHRQHAYPASALAGAPYTADCAGGARLRRARGRARVGRCDNGGQRVFEFGPRVAPMMDESGSGLPFG